MTLDDRLGPEPTRRLRRVVIRSALALGVLLGLAAAPATVEALRDRPFDVAADAALADGSEPIDRATPEGRAMSARHGTPPTRTTPAADGGRRSADLPAFTHRSASLADVSRVPARVRIDALGVDAPIVARGTDQRGQLDVPPDGGTVVWYRAGSVPGASGSAVLAAHVDHAGAPGAFLHLDRLGPGDLVHVDLDDGSSRTFAVVRRHRYRKERLPVERLFTRDGDAVLTLITCGGRFNETTRHYDANTVVQAVLR